MISALGAWMRERFPARNAVFFAVFYLSALLVSRASTTTGTVSLYWTDIPGFVALSSFFLALRIADEHKDFDADAVAHPDRVLQRGLVTLRQLQGIGAVAVLLQIALSLLLDGGVGAVTRCWLATMAWSALMTREFFAREWLRRHLIVYALSHMLVMPFATLWVASMAVSDAVHAPTVWLFAALSFLAGLAFEIARKMRAPELEHPLADSYTQSLGVANASRLLFTVVIAASAVALMLTASITGRTGITPLIVLSVVIALAGVALAGFRQRPTVDTAKRAEAAVGVAALATHLVPVVTLLVARGVVR